MRLSSVASSSIPAGILVGLLLAAGCAPRRTIRITTDPPGAVVRLDDETIGVTPLRHRFYHYGVRRITLQKDGFATYSEEIALQPVWWARFPIDVFSEVLLPFGWRDKRKYHHTMEEGSEVMSMPSLHSVIERADVLRYAGTNGPRDLPKPQPVQLPAVGEDEDPDDPQGNGEEP